MSDRGYGGRDAVVARLLAGQCGVCGEKLVGGRVALCAGCQEAIRQKRGVRALPKEAVAYRGEDGWTAEEAENGWVPSDAVWVERGEGEPR